MEQRFFLCLCNVFLRFVTQYGAYCRTAKQKISKRWTGSVWETRRGRTTHDKNIATEAHHPASVVHSAVKRYLHFEFRRRWSLGWPWYPTTTTNRNRQDNWLVVEIPQRCWVPLRHHTLELLAVIWAVLLLRPYLEGTRFKARANHDVRRLILNLTDGWGNFTHWRLRITEFKLDVVTWVSIRGQAVDALSWHLTKGGDITALADVLPILTIVPLEKQKRGRR